jgi:hypothetical protein
MVRAWSDLSGTLARMGRESSKRVGDRTMFLPRGEMIGRGTWTFLSWNAFFMDGTIPLDRWFDPWHDGTKTAHSVDSARLGAHVYSIDTGQNLRLLRRQRPLTNFPPHRN